MTTLTNRGPADQPTPVQKTGVVRTTLFAGGSFAGMIATILGTAGAWRLDDTVVLYALVTLCLVTMLSLLTAAFLAR